MGKHLLELDYDFNFLLIGISCHTKDYRLTWAINNKLGTKLEKGEDLEIIAGKDQVMKIYSLYHYENQENYSNLFLLSNRSRNGLLIPEEKQADYFLIWKGPGYLEEKKEIINQLREIPFVNTAYEINPYNLKSKQNLMF